MFRFLNLKKTDAQQGKVSPEKNEKVEHLKGYIRRVGSGEDLESVRKDFAREFASVSVHDIVQAEEGLIADGMPQAEVQKLCDLHSALFHGKTEAEVWQEEEAAAKAKKQEIGPGHPVDVLRREDAALEALIDGAMDHIAEEDAARVGEDLQKLGKIRVLYGKKEELLMPVLSKKGVIGPVDVMWGVDDEIKKEVSRIAGAFREKGLDEIEEDLLAVLSRMKEMIYKEEKIFFPLCLEKFSFEEWVDVYRDLPEMGNVFVTEDAPRWEKGEEALAARRETEKAAISDGIMKLPGGGELTVAQLQGIFSLLPVDVTFIDENDVNRFFSNNGKVFSRPQSALGRVVFECHPKPVRLIVKKLLEDFKAGRKDQMEVWVPKRPVRILYMAVRSPEGKYLGTVEFVQDFSEIRKHL